LDPSRLPRRSRRAHAQATLKAIEDDIAADLAKVGITVNTRLLDKEAFNEAMVSGDFNMAFSESWGAPYDPQAFAASWATPDEAYYAALSGLSPPYTQDVINEKVQAALTMKSEPAREEAWTEILTALVGTQPRHLPPPAPGPWRDPPRFLPAHFNLLL